MLCKSLFDGGVIIPFTNATCKYCGRPFFKKANKECYCSDRCRGLALREQKAEYQRRRRKLIKSGVLVSEECNEPGTMFMGPHRCDDFDKEHETIRKEMNRLGVKRREH